MKWIIGLSKIVISTVLISALSVCTSWFIINAYVESVLKQMNLSIPTLNATFTDFVSHLSSSVNKMKPGEATLTPETSSGESTDAPDADAEDSASSTAANQDDASGENPSEEDAVAVWGQMSYQGQQQGEAEQKREIVMSVEEFNRKKEQLTNEDKMKIFSFLATRLPQQELQRISLFVENGITEEELKEVGQLVEDYLQPEEYDELVAILDKY